ncbi:TRAM domain-containing protein [Patescibacteria group bacterium]|nr:TRAM domain-containing protein [Patescibacteria group bacterium]
MKKNRKTESTKQSVPETKQPEKGTQKPVVAATPAFTKALAREIVKNLAAFGRFTAKPFQRDPQPPPPKTEEKPSGEFPILVDTSVLIDGRITPIVNSGFFSGTLVILQFVLGELQHIADSDDSLRRAKGRRGLDVVNTLRRQRANPRVKTIISSSDTQEKDVDQKLVRLGKLWSVPILTVDFNLAQVARASGVRVMNINDLAQALKLALIPGEELTVKITHPGRERMQGVGYLTDGTMVVVENTKERVGQEVVVVITKVHQSPAGQLFFARLK